MSDIYAAPESDVVLKRRAGPGGGNVEDAINGEIEVGMFETLGEAWRGLKGFKLKCLIATVIWFVVYMVALMVSVPVMIGLRAIGATEVSVSIIGTLVQIIAVAATMPVMVGIVIMGIRHSQGKQLSAGSIFNYFHRVPTVMLWYLLMYLMLIVGYLLLILPGIYLTFAYMFSLPLVIEKDMSAWRALEISRKAVTRLWFRATGFLLLIMLLLALITTPFFVIPFGVAVMWFESWLGLALIPLAILVIWVLPWVWLAYSMLYFKLFGAEAQTLAD